MLGMFGNLCVSIHSDLISRNSDFHPVLKETGTETLTDKMRLGQVVRMCRAQPVPGCVAFNDWPKSA